MNPQEWGKRAQRIRVPASMVLGIVFLAFMRPSLGSIGVGAAIALAGAGLRVWAAGHLEKGKALAQSGPYRFTRNPLYLGSLLMASGVLVAGKGYWLLPPFALFYGVVYYSVMKAEEIELGQRYGDEYRRYASRVAIFLPKWSAGPFGPGHSSEAAGEFSWSRVLRNGEHRTMAGLLVIGGFLILRAKWFVQPWGWPHL